MRISSIELFSFLPASVSSSTSRSSFSFSPRSAFLKNHLFLWLNLTRTHDSAGSSRATSQGEPLYQCSLSNNPCKIYKSVESYFSGRREGIVGNEGGSWIHCAVHPSLVKYTFNSIHFRRGPVEVCIRPSQSCTYIILKTIFASTKFV